MPSSCADPWGSGASRAPPTFASAAVGPMPWPASVSIDGRRPHHASATARSRRRSPVRGHATGVRSTLLDGHCRRGDRHRDRCPLMRGRSRRRRWTPGPCTGDTRATRARLQRPRPSCECRARGCHRGSVPAARSAFERHTSRVGRPGDAGSPGNGVRRDDRAARSRVRGTGHGGLVPHPVDRIAGRLHQRSGPTGPAHLLSSYAISIRTKENTS